MITKRLTSLFFCFFLRRNNFPALMRPAGDSERWEVVDPGKRGHGKSRKLLAGGPLEASVEKRRRLPGEQLWESSSGV